MNDWKIEDSLGYLIGRVGKILAGNLSRNFADAGYEFQVQHWILLNMLHREDGINQQEVVCLTGRDKTAVTRMVDQLEKQNLLVRVPDRQDRRIKRLYLTNLGKSTYSELLEVVINTNRSFQENIDPEDLKTCKKVLNQLLELENSKVV